MWIELKEGLEGKLGRLAQDVFAVPAGFYQTTHWSLFSSKTDIMMFDSIFMTREALNRDDSILKRYWVFFVPKAGFVGIAKSDARVSVPKVYRGLVNT